RPMKPAPKMASREAPSRASRSRTTSSRVRRVYAGTWSGSIGRGREPVAITSPSYGTGVPPSSVTVRAAGSSARAGRPSSSRTAIDSYHDGSRSRIDSLSGPYRSASLESGGRSYGRWGSAPTRVRSPSNPLARRVSMAWTAASDAPTTTTLCMTYHLCRLWLAHHQAGHGDEECDAEQVSHIEDHRPLERGHHVEVLEIG